MRRNEKNAVIRETKKKRGGIRETTKKKGEASEKQQKKGKGHPRNNKKREEASEKQQKRKGHPRNNKKERRHPRNNKKERRHPRNNKKEGGIRETTKKEGGIRETKKRGGASEKQKKTRLEPTMMSHHCQHCAQVLVSLSLSARWSGRCERFVVSHADTPSTAARFSAAGRSYSQFFANDWHWNISKPSDSKRHMSQASFTRSRGAALARAVHQRHEPLFHQSTDYSPLLLSKANTRRVVRVGKPGEVEFTRLRAHGILHGKMKALSMSSPLQPESTMSQISSCNRPSTIERLRC